jgi:restriction endonuclease Mrr
MKSITEALRQARRENVLRIGQFISQMDAFQFEWLVAAVLVRSGYTDVEVTSRSGDKGFDVRATIKAGGFAPLRVFVQAKRQQSVGRPIVQKLRGACPSGYSGMLVTSGDFTRDARDEADDPTKHNSITLISGAQFAELMLDHGVGAERKQLETHVLVLEQMTEQHLRDIVQVPEL